jgi:hypothetical protein
LLLAGSSSLPWLIAEFLSLRIAELHRISNTVCEFCIERADLREEFSRFLSLGEGESISIVKINYCMENSVLFDVLLEGGGDSMTVDEAFSIFGCRLDCISIDLVKSTFLHHACMILIFHSMEI